MIDNCRYVDLYRSAVSLLKPIEGDNAEFSARQIVAAATDRTVSKLVADFQLTAFQRDIRKVDDMVQRRLRGEPLAYILGEWEFHGLRIAVTPDVLIPREDSEVLCELVLHEVKLMRQNPRVLDLCAGSGCLGLAIAANVRDVRVTLGEISREAIQVAKKNIQNLHLGGRVTCVQMDVRETPPKFLGSYDLIMANPPYVTDQEMEKLDPEVRCYEPELALRGGVDGLDFYRAITENFTPILKPGGFLCFEFGMGQETGVCKILMENGYRLGRLAKDSGDRIRAVLAMKPGKSEQENSEQEQ